VTPASAPPTLLPAPHGRAYLTRPATGERYCLPAPPPRRAPLAPHPGAWHTAATYPGGPAAFERASALPIPVAAALAALLPLAESPVGRPARAPATPDAALIAETMARGGYRSRHDLAVAVAARVEGQHTAAGVYRALSRACAPPGRGWRGGASALGEEVRGVLEEMVGGAAQKAAE